MGRPAPIRRGPAERLAAWLVTGPLGRLYAAAADVGVLWARYTARRARRRLRIRKAGQR